LLHCAGASRLIHLAEIPNLQIPKKAKKDDKIDAIVKNLVYSGQSRLRKVKTLQNVISNLVSETLDEAELAALVDELKRAILSTHSRQVDSDQR